MSKNLTKLDLAIKVGSDTRQIQRIENGENSTSIVIAHNLAKTLEVTMNCLIFELTRKIHPAKYEQYPSINEQTFFIVSSQSPFFSKG